MNAYDSIDVTLLGILTDSREMQLWNVYESIIVTLLGILTEVRELQPSNA